jgi:hypothetical protein
MLAPRHLNRAVTGPGVVATDAEQRKRVKYSTISQTHHFIPVAVETLGALGEDAASFLKELRSQIAAVTKKSRASEFLLQRISVAIKRGNAACILGTLSSCSSSDLDDIFYL